MKTVPEKSVKRHKINEASASAGEKREVCRDARMSVYRINIPILVFFPQFSFSALKYVFKLTTEKSSRKKDKQVEQEMEFRQGDDDDDNKGLCVRFAESDRVR